MTRLEQLVDQVFKSSVGPEERARLVKALQASMSQGRTADTKISASTGTMDIAQANLIALAKGELRRLGLAVGSNGTVSEIEVNKALAGRDPESRIRIKSVLHSASLIQLC